MAVLNWLSLAGYVASMVSGYIRYNGVSIGTVSSYYPTPVTPVGFAFAIWGLIYAAVGAYTIWQLTSNGSSSPYSKAINVWFLIACVCQSLWTPSFCYEILPLSGVFMVGIWVSLFAVNVHLFRINQQKQKEGTLSFWGAQLVSFPFSIWFGWITAATLINVTVVFIYSFNWSFFSSAVWGCVVIFVASSFALLWGAITFSWPYCLTLAWAAFGIYSRHDDSPVNLVAASAAGSLLFFAISIAILAVVSHHLIQRAIKLGVFSTGTQAREHLPAIDEEMQTVYHFQNHPAGQQQILVDGQPAVVFTHLK